MSGPVARIVVAAVAFSAVGCGRPEPEYLPPKPSQFEQLRTITLGGSPLRSTRFHALHVYSNGLHTFLSDSARLGPEQVLFLLTDADVYEHLTRVALLGHGSYQQLATEQGDTRIVFPYVNGRTPAALSLYGVMADSSLFPTGVLNRLSQELAATAGVLTRDLSDELRQVVSRLFDYGVRLGHVRGDAVFGGQPVAIVVQNPFPDSTWRACADSDRLCQVADTSYRGGQLFLRVRAEEAYWRFSDLRPSGLMPSSEHVSICGPVVDSLGLLRWEDFVSSVELPDAEYAIERRAIAASRFRRRLTRTDFSSLKALPGEVWDYWARPTGAGPAESEPMIGLVGRLDGCLSDAFEEVFDRFGRFVLQAAEFERDLPDSVELDLVDLEQYADYIRELDGFRDCRSETADRYACSDPTSKRLDDFRHLLRDRIERHYHRPRAELLRTSVSSRHSRYTSRLAAQDSVADELFNSLDLVSGCPECMRKIQESLRGYCLSRASNHGPLAYLKTGGAGLEVIDPQEQTLRVPATYLVHTVLPRNGPKQELLCDRFVHLESRSPVLEILPPATIRTRSPGTAQLRTYFQPPWSSADDLQELRHLAPDVLPEIDTITISARDRLGEVGEREDLIINEPVTLSLRFWSNYPDGSDGKELPTRFFPFPIQWSVTPPGLGSVAADSLDSAWGKAIFKNSSEPTVHATRFKPHVHALRTFRVVHPYSVELQAASRVTDSVVHGDTVDLMAVVLDSSTRPINRRIKFDWGVTGPAELIRVPREPSRMRIAGATREGITTVHVKALTMADSVQVRVVHGLVTLAIQHRLHADSTAAVQDSSLALEVGESRQLNATGLDRLGHRVPVEVVWCSHDPMVATADESGRILGVSAGVAKMEVRAGSVLQTLQVVVSDPPDEARRLVLQPEMEESRGSVCDSRS